MTTIDKLANELFPCPSNCPSKQMTAKYMRENFKQAVNMVADEIRRVNGAHRVTPNFGEVRSKFESGGVIPFPKMAITGLGEAPEYFLTGEQLEAIMKKYFGHNTKSISGEASGEK